MKVTTSLLVLAAATSLAHAGIESQVVNFDHGFEGEFINFQQFDTMGGTRELTGLSLSYDQTITLDLLIQSNGYTALNDGDWLMDAGYLSIHQFGLAEEGGDGEPGPPFIGPGAVFDQVSGDLGISDGYNNGGIDTLNAIITDSFVFNASFDGSTEFDQRMFDAFTGPGTLETFMAGFSELFFQWINDPNWIVDPNNPPEGPFDGPFIDPFYGIFVDLQSLSHSGAITVNYEFTTVPAPSALALLAGAALGTTRRRRKTH